MTIPEMTEVMNAFAEGKKIQFTSVANKDMVWMDTDNPTWDFSSYNYRIKPEGRRPYISSEEMVDDFKKRFNVKDWPNHAMPLIWMTQKDTYSPNLVTKFDPEGVLFGVFGFKFGELFNDFTYLDGSVVGIEEENQ